MAKDLKLSPRALDKISAYIDGQLPAAEMQEVRAKLASSSAWGQAHERMLALRGTMRALPMKKVPRNFILTRAEAREAKRGLGWVKSFGLAASLCAVFLVALFGFDFAKQFTMMKATAPMAMPMSAMYEEGISPDLAKDVAETESPMVLNWVYETGRGGGGSSGTFGNVESDALPSGADTPTDSNESEEGAVQSEMRASSAGATSEPLILGLNLEKQSEVIAMAPIFKQDQDAGADVYPMEDRVEESALSKEQEAMSEHEALSAEEAHADEEAPPQDMETDHKAYITAQLSLWLKIGLATLAVVFAVLWLILRRR